MADISKYLEDILSAIYGEEVRHSIHDAIDAINKEVYTGAEDAREQVAKAAAEAANAALSAQSAASEADRATVAADNAGSSAGQAYMSATQATNQASNAANSASSAAESATSALDSKNAAAVSAAEALVSQNAAAGSASEAANSSLKASSSAGQAATSASQATNQASRAATSASEADESAKAAKASADSASNSASSASTNAAAAENSASNAAASATKAESWAVGGTDSRDGEGTNNAKYYSDLAQRAATGISGALSAQGTIPFDQLNTVSPSVGWMYNISTDFTTDERFAEGAGVPYKAGTNVYWTADSKWDCLVAGSAEENKINTVKVNGTPLVPDAEKAVDIEAYNEDNKPEIGGRNYALDTNSGAAHWRWSTDGDTTNTVESILINGRNGVKLTRSSNEMGGYSYIQYNLPNLKALLPDTVYTVSCMVYSTNGFSPNFIIQEGTAANKLSNQSGGTQIPKGSWGKYISTIRTVSEDNFNLRNQVLYFSMSAEQSAPNAEVIIYDLKLERGEIPTDWTPAPEDLEAEIPKSISQLANDSGFITRNDIPEGIAASNTTPLPPTNTGDVGHELMFARGDHVHPFSDLEVISKKGIDGNADLNDFYKNGFYILHDLSTFKNAPQDVPYDFGMLMVFNTDADYGEKYVQQIIALNAGYSKFIWTRTANGPSYEANYVWSPWHKIATFEDITASNFSGVLPIEKGGTNNSRSFNSRSFIDDTITPDNFRGQIGQPKFSDFILPDRHRDDSMSGKYWLGSASGVKFGVGDTHGYLATSYSEPDAIVGGGNENKINWSRHLAFRDQIPTIATSTTAGLVKPGEGLQISDDGTLSVVDSGGGSGSTRYGTFMLTGIYGQGTQKDLLNVSYSKISGENPNDFFGSPLVNAGNIWKTITDEGRITFFSDNVYPLTQSGYYMHQTIFEFSCMYGHSSDAPIIDDFYGSISLTAITNDVGKYDDFNKLSEGLKEQLKSHSSSFYTVPASGVMNVTFKNIT